MKSPHRDRLHLGLAALPGLLALALLLWGWHYSPLRLPAVPGSRIDQRNLGDFLEQEGERARRLDEAKCRLEASWPELEGYRGPHNVPEGDEHVCDRPPAPP